METAEELKKWTSSLVAAEKRFIKLLGKARGGTVSQQLKLFDWLNANPGDESFPSNAKFLQNLPTVANRLKDLILDGLHLLHKNDDTDARFRTSLDEIAILYSKKLYRPASREIRRTKKLALDTCRYAVALQCLDWEQKMTAQFPTGQTRETLKALREEEIAVHEKLGDLRDLQHRHDMLLSLVRQFFFHRDAHILAEVRSLSENENIARIAESGAYLEQALAVNIIGLRNLYERNPAPALVLYQKLLRTWEKQLDWQQDQVELLLLICKSYLTVCFYSPVDWAEVRQYLTLMADFEGLKKDDQRNFREMLYQNQFALALNTGKFDLVNVLIPEIDRWLQEESEHLSEAQVLPFLCNFTVAEFLAGNYAAANRFAMRILNAGSKKVRIDIRDFALVLQAVIQYELNNDGLNEYLMRSGKRHFRKNETYEINFELQVFRQLELLLKTDSSKEKKQIFGNLVDALEKLAQEKGDSIPLLGLKEVTMWAYAHLNDITLKEVFISEVKKNLAALEEAGGVVTEEKTAT
ncbi:MAG TPA: hypothetical protein VK826_07555 [Bacteroidia bacterium]|nr:hypothetical protein [Bacteroidia bacterium]